MTIPFTKAHGARNDFLLTWASDAPHAGLEKIAVAICDRHAGIGADGWYLVKRGTDGHDLELRLFNSDGSKAELSGNGTRCAAAFLFDSGFQGREVRVLTGAGKKYLRLIEREDSRYVFEMNMGSPTVIERDFPLPLASGVRPVYIIDVGNPQCAVMVEEFPAGWRQLGAEIERHPHFSNRTNVSFVRVLDEQTIDVRFYERGAGETMSSGTGSTGAAAAAIAAGRVSSPVKIKTPAGGLDLRVKNGEFWLEGPAEIVGKGEFYL
jgi:diaminopimelate epimerase